MGKPESKYVICTRCIMDTSDEEISFDIDGVCNHCNKYDYFVGTNNIKSNEKAARLDRQINKIKRAGEGRKYDCIIGLSGGMDSSYVVYLAKIFNLRALIVHFDNSWDSELAMKNIEHILDKTGYDYYNYVVDWEEFKDIQRSYFQASVVDLEVPTDMGIISLLKRLCLKFNVKYILSGTNVVTELTMGQNWNYSKMDRSNLIDIHNRYGKMKLVTFPLLSQKEEFLFKVKKIKQVNMLEFVDFDIFKVKEILAKTYGWKPYEIKHGESIFTKFYQVYYLPKKFNIDKRRAHLSDEINAGFISRDEALVKLKVPVYKSVEEEQREFDYISRKLGYKNFEFEEVINLPSRPHKDFVSEKPYGTIFDKLFWRLNHSDKFVTVVRKFFTLFGI